MHAFQRKFWICIFILQMLADIFSHKSTAILTAVSKKFDLEGKNLYLYWRDDRLSSVFFTILLIIALSLY